MSEAKYVGWPFERMMTLSRSSPSSEEANQTAPGAPFLFLGPGFERFDSLHQNGSGFGDQRRGGKLRSSHDADIIPYI